MAMAQLPPGAFLKDISAWYNQDTIPRELRATHALPAEHWGQVVVDHGEVNLFLDGSKTAVVVTPGQPVVIGPETPFSLSATGKPGRFCLHYFHLPLVMDAKELAGELGGHAA